MFCYRVAKYIGSYVAAMNGVDAIAFTAGIGENDRHCPQDGSLPILAIWGLRWTRKRTKKRGEDLVISTADSKVKVACNPYQRRAGHCKRDGGAGIR